MRIFLIYFILICLAISSFSCLQKKQRKYLPEGYHRIELTKKNNIKKKFSFEESSFSFLAPDYFKTKSNIKEINSKKYLEIKLENSQHNFSFILNYRPIQNNLSQLINEAYNPQILNTSDGIIETKDQEGKVLIYELKGKVANPFLFHITDKVNHFLHGMMFVCSDPKKNCNLNIDSLKPVIEYFEEDMYSLINSIKWTKEY